jgi:hypothetical protein
MRRGEAPVESGQRSELVPGAFRCDAPTTLSRGELATLGAARDNCEDCRISGAAMSVGDLVAGSHRVAYLRRIILDDRVRLDRFTFNRA